GARGAASRSPVRAPRPDDPGAGRRARALFRPAVRVLWPQHGRPDLVRAGPRTAPPRRPRAAPSVRVRPPRAAGAEPRGADPRSAGAGVLEQVARAERHARRGAAARRADEAA